MIFFIKKKVLLSAAIILLLLIATSFGVAVPVQGNNWGLSYKKDESPPTGNEGAEFLKQYNAYYLGNTKEKEIYLTFDAGFENNCTASILDALKAENVKATFFVEHNYVKTAPDILKRIVEEGHTVGNHTYSHKDVTKMGNEEFEKELKDLEKLFLETTGFEMSKFYRPPAGKYSVENIKTANELGYKTIFWSLAYEDWILDKQPTKEKAFSKLIPRVHNGAIILLHNTSTTNAEILPELIKKYREMGYAFKELSSLCEVK